MSVVVAVEDAGVCRKQLTIEVPAPAVEAESQRVAEEYRKSASLPGFRKGKVPLGVVKKRFSDEIRKEVIDRLVPRYWHQAEAESGLDALMPPSVERVDFEEGTKLTFDAVVEVRPEIELKDIENFDLPELDIEATQEDVDQALEDLRRSVAEWTDAERPAARGDMVVGTLRDVADEEGDPQPVAFEVGDEKVWEELTLSVTGQKAGTTADFDREEEREEGEPPTKVSYHVVIDNVRERELPEVNDDFVKQVSDVETVDELRDRIQERIKVTRERELRVRRERAVLDQLRERHPMELPAGVVDQETERMLRSYAEDLSMRGIDPSKAEIDWQQLFEQTRPQGEKEVQGRLLLDAVVGKLEVEVSEDEFETSLAALAKMQGQPTTAMRKSLDRAGRLGELRTQLARDKALKRLMGDEAPPEAEAESESESESESEA